MQVEPLVMLRYESASQACPASFVRHHAGVQHGRRHGHSVLGVDGLRKSQQTARCFSRFCGPQQHHNFHGRGRCAKSVQNSSMLTPEGCPSKLHPTSSLNEHQVEYGHARNLRRNTLEIRNTKFMEVCACPGGRVSTSSCTM